jgi:hypothetical protein
MAKRSNRKKKHEPLISLFGASVEVKNLTAVQSLKIVLIHNKKLRKEKAVLESIIEGFGDDVSTKGQARKIQELLNKISELEGVIAKQKLGLPIVPSDLKSYKGSGKLKDILNGS